MGAVAVFVVGLVVVGQEVEARHEARACKIWDAADTSVDYRHHHATALAQLPRRGQPDLAQVPLVAETGIVGEAQACDT